MRTQQEKIIEERIQNFIGKQTVSLSVSIPDHLVNTAELYSDIYRLRQEK